MEAQVIDLTERRDGKYLEGLTRGQQVTLNLGGKTQLAFYKEGLVKLRPQMIGPKRIITGDNALRFAIKNGGEIKIAEFCPWDPDLKVVNNEIHLPSEYSDLGYEGWRHVNPDSQYGQNINKKFARVGL
ncbi:hypothetical protein HYT24_01315 [Candidatus Pacearchaeota archaeon]|nr:hypothetical protein [Candidatus Pacearchaeota archaeon]